MTENPQTIEVLEPEAAIAAMLVVLERCRQREFNWMEPTKQNALYKDICEVVTRVTGVDPSDAPVTQDEAEEAAGTGRGLG